MELKQVKSIVFQTEIGAMLANNMECSEPILTQSPDGLTDNFFVYAMSMDGVCTAPLAKFGLLAEKRQITQLVFCRDEPFSVPPDKEITFVPTEPGRQDGISKAFKLLCNVYDIKCILIMGDADGETDPGGDFKHAWNLVKIENCPYHVDVTWDNMGKVGIKKVGYDYFNVTTEDILKDHTPDVQLPICTDTALNYFHFTNSFVGTYKELYTFIKQRKNSPEIVFKIKPGSSEFRTMDEVKAKT